MKAHGELQSLPGALQRQGRPFLCSGKVSSGNSHVVRAAKSRTRYDSEDDIIFGAGGSWEEAPKGASHSMLAVHQQLSAQKPGGGDLYALEAFSNIEDWVDLKEFNGKNVLREELSCKSKKSLVVICYKRGIGAGGNRSELIDRIVNHEFSQGDAEDVEKLTLASIMQGTRTTL